MKYKAVAIAFFGLTAATQAQIDALTEEGKRLCQTASASKNERYKFLQSKLNECSVFYSGEKAAACEQTQRARLDEFYGQCVDANTRAMESQNRAKLRDRRNISEPS
jgi:hypothetical protein